MKHWGEPFSCVNLFDTLNRLDMLVKRPGPLLQHSCNRCLAQTVLHMQTLLSLHQFEARCFHPIRDT
jgi:hypothetical protein